MYFEVPDMTLDFPRDFIKATRDLAFEHIAIFDYLRSGYRKETVTRLLLLGALSVGTPVALKNMLGGHPARPMIGIPASAILALGFASTSDALRNRRWADRGWEVTAEVATNAIEDLVQQPSERKYSPFATQMLPEPNSSPMLAQTITIKPIQWFEWTRLAKERNDFPHILVLAGTGVGKSTTVQWLCSELKQPNTITIAVDPHHEPGDYDTADLVICKARKVGYDAREYKLVKEAKYNSKGEETSPEVWQGEPDVRFSEILNGTASPTACQFLRSLVNLMDTRYNLRSASKPYKGTPEHPYIEAILDEYPIYASLPGVNECIPMLIREARKVGIRLYIMTQGDLLKALGLEGQSDVRENLTYLRLGQWAEDHIKAIAKGLKANDPELPMWLEVIEKLKVTKWKAAVDDSPAIVPDLSGILKGTSGSPNIPIKSTTDVPNVDAKGTLGSPQVGVSNPQLTHKLLQLEKSEGTYGLVKEPFQVFEDLEDTYGDIMVRPSDLEDIFKVPHTQAKAWLEGRGYIKRQVRRNGATIWVYSSHNNSLKGTYLVSPGASDSLDVSLEGSDS